MFPLSGRFLEFFVFLAVIDKVKFNGLQRHGIKQTSDQQILLFLFVYCRFMFTLATGRKKYNFSAHLSSTCPLFVFVSFTLSLLFFSSSCSLSLLPSTISLLFSMISCLSHSPSFPTASYPSIRSDLFLVTSLPSISPPCCQLFIIFLISLSWFIIFCVGMWSASQVGEPLQSNSFLKIRLPVGEPSQPVPARKSVCVCSFSPALSHSVFTSCSHCVSLYYFVTKIAISLHFSTLCMCV